jgi:hypothetical protein
VLSHGKLRGLMVATMARELGITFEAAEELAADCAKRGWLEHASHTVALQEPGIAVASEVLEEASRTEARPSSRRRPPPT